MNDKICKKSIDDRIDNKILVIEDDESLCILIERRLNRAGFSTEGISNGTGAIKKIIDNRYHLLLLDYTLPDMSGVQFVRALADLEYNIPFIIITGQENEDIINEMMELGAKEYLVKNNSFLNSLIHSVQEVLG